MRYMGIDFGTKRIGIAISDESGHFALPHGVLANSVHIIDDLKDIIIPHEIKYIVIGESKNFKGQENTIMKDIHALKLDLEHQFKIPVVFEPEFLSSHQAQKIQGKNAMLDASAAAIILQSHLDRLQNNSSIQ